MASDGKTSSEKIIDVSKICYDTRKITESDSSLGFFLRNDLVFIEI